MAGKRTREDLIEEYLKNRETFVKQACEEIESEIKQDIRGLKKAS
jgi:hypothetical protein